MKKQNHTPRGEQSHSKGVGLVPEVRLPEGNGYCRVVLTWGPFCIALIIVDGSLVAGVGGCFVHHSTCKLAIKKYKYFM